MEKLFLDKVSHKDGIRPDMDRKLQERSLAFARATQRKGMPMTYGSGVKEKPK